MKDLKECRPQRLKMLKTIEFWCHFMPSEMVKEAMSPYTRKTNWYTKFFQGRHKDLNEFKSHVISFTDIKTVAVQKGIE